MARMSRTCLLTLRRTQRSVDAESIMPESRYSRFDERTIKFLHELKANNNREWFKANKIRYDEDVLDVALYFIQSHHENEKWGH